MKIKLDTARQMLKYLYASSGLIGDELDWMVELALDYDLEGNFFSGFEEVEDDMKKIAAKSTESLDLDLPALKLVNGHGKSAKLLMHALIPQSVRWAHEQGAIVVGIKNAGYHGSLGTIARKFAEQGLLCIYSSNGGPQGVVPYGGTKDVCGTNPLAYGIPTSGLPIVFDAATAIRAYGTIRKARERHEELPENMYLDSNGHYTTDPTAAIALIPFGGYKGFAINVMLEVMTGALVGAKSGTLVSNDDDIGAFLILIDPAALGSVEEFTAQTDKLVEDIKNNVPAKNFTEVRVPGYRSQELRQKQLQNGEFEVDDAIWQKFSAFYETQLK